MKFRGPAQAALEYASVRPLDLGSAWAIYMGISRFVVMRLASRAKPTTVGQCVVASRELLVQSQGLRFWIRPETEDLGYLTPHHKASVSKWFTPRPGQVVVDVGSHIGYFALLAGRSGATTYAFEPSEPTYRILRANVTLNGLSNVFPINLAVGREAATRALRTPGRFGGLATLKDVVRAGGNHVESVGVRPLDSVPGIVDRPKIDWLLIDTEGWESEVLEGGRVTLSKSDCVIIEVEHGPGASRCKELLQESGLRIVAREPQSRENDYWLCVRPSA